MRWLWPIWAKKTSAYESSAKHLASVKRVFAIAEFCRMKMRKLPIGFLNSRELGQIGDLDCAIFYLSNVKGFQWNHKRVYRIYRDLELNLRIKPKKRLVREKADSLKAPQKINETWSMDFMHDQLGDPRS